MNFDFAKVLIANSSKSVTLYSVHSVYFVLSSQTPLFLQIVDHAYKQGIASWYPEPKDKEAFILSQVYNSDYDSFTLDSYSWPKDAMKVQDV